MTDMMLTGRAYSADEGQQFGLSNYLVGVGEGLAKGVELAHKIAGNARMTNFALTHVLPRIADAPHEHGLIIEALVAAIAQSAPEAKERIQQFLTKQAGTKVGKPMRGYRWADDPAAIEEMRRKAPAAVGDCFDLIERKMIEGPWVMGEAYTVCDPYLFTLAQWLEADGVNPAQLPKIQDHRRRMSERRAVKKALAEELSPARQ